MQRKYKIRKNTSFFSFLLCSLLLAVSGQTAYADVDVQPVSFLDAPDPAPARGETHYTIKYRNHGTDPADNPRLEVEVPNGFSYSETDDAGCSYNGATPSTGGLDDRVICTWATLAAESERDIDITLIAADVTGNYPTTATASADNETAGTGGNNVETNTTDVEESADLEMVDKEGTPDPVPAGGVSTYRLEVRNNGPYDATNLVFTDALPPGLDFLADNAVPSADDDGDWACSASGQDVTCTSASLTNGSTTVFHFRVTVTSSSIGGITNTAVIASDTPEPTPNNNLITDDIEILEGTDMSIAKTVLTPHVIAGQPIEFSVTATNEGPMSAAGVRVTDTLPAGYSNVAVSLAGWDCSGSSGINIVCDKNTDMPAGDIAVFSVTATVSAAVSPPDHQNTATVSTTTEDPNPANDTVTVPYPVNPDIADLEISKSKSPHPIFQGNTATSTIVVENHGPRPADPVQVVDVLSANETYQSGSDGNWTCVHSGGATPAVAPGGTVTCDYNNVPLAVDATAATLSIITEATNPGDLSNTACTGGSGGSTPPDYGDSITGNNCASANVNSTSEQADLVVSKLAEGVETFTLLEDANSFTYTVLIHNNGPNTAEAVTFTDVIPEYISGTGNRPATAITPSTTQGSCSLVGSGDTVSCSFGDMASGSDVTVSILVARPMRNGTRTNRASAYSTVTGDRYRSNNTDTAEVTVEPQTDIAVTSKEVAYSNSPDPILAGTTATYTIQVRNHGPSRAEAVVLEDVFSGEAFTYINSSVTTTGGGGSCAWSAPTLSCDLNNMNANTIKSITVVIMPDQLAPSGDWEIDNTATVSMDTEDSRTDNNEQSVTLPVQNGQADLAVEKDESPDFLEPVRFDPALGNANYIVYEIVVSNRGPSLATDIIFTDNLISVTPSEGQQLGFIRDTENSDGTVGSGPICTAPTPNPFTVDGSNQDIVCTLPGDLASGADYSRYLVFEVLDAPNSLTGDVYRDEVVVSSAEVDNESGNDSADESTTVRTIVDLEIVKTGPTSTVEVEENFSFTLTVTNHGPGDGPETTVTDNLPADMVLTGTPSSTTAGVTVTCTGTTGATDFTCNIDSDPTAVDQMENGTSAVITVPVKLTAFPAGGTITNTASVSSLAPEPNSDPHPNSDEHPVNLFEVATLGNFVWYDRNADGIQDIGESGVSSVTVNLLDATGTQVKTTTTNGSGMYLFTIEHAANYFVQFIQPSNYYFSPVNTGNADVDSDADPTTGLTNSITINFGDNILTVDAGIYQLSTNPSAGIDIEKATNGKDADSAPGPTIKPDKDVSWTYVVTNTGSLTLTNILVTDDMGVAVTCPKTTLLSSEVMACTGSGLAVEGQYENNGIVTGVTSTDELVRDNDPSHYKGHSFVWAMFIPAFTPHCPVVPDYCYLVADGDNASSTNSPLFTYTFETDSLELLNRLGVDDVETIALSLDGKTLYAADNGVLGIIDPTVGKDNSFSAINPSGIGSGRGELGVIELTDIDGMAFDPDSGILYGSVRRQDHHGQSLDLIVHIDHQQGRLIKDAFGAGIDYVVIKTAHLNAGDVDDIAIDRDGTLFGIAGNSGGLGGDHQGTINKQTGAVESSWPLTNNGVPVQDMEGLTSYNIKILYGTTGVEFGQEETDNTLYSIEKDTGQTTPVVRLNQDFNGYIPNDFEAISCFPVCK